MRLRDIIQTRCTPCLSMRDDCKSSRMAVTLWVAILGLLFSFAVPSYAADIIIVGDAHLKPVSEIVTTVRKNVRGQVAVYSPSEAAGAMNQIVLREGAKTVIALGKDAIDEALLLPPSIGVIYGLVILPLKVDRPNTTGTYMAPPVNEYLSLIKRFLPSLRHLSVIGSTAMHKTLSMEENPLVTNYQANSSFDLITRVQQIGNTDALLILPDASMLSAATMDKISLYSFRKRVPILGISEKNVKQGSLFALVFDPASVGKQLAKLATESLKGNDLGAVPVSPPRKFHLYLNTDTAEKMGITIPDSLLKQATKVFP